MRSLGLATAIVVAASISPRVAAEEMTVLLRPEATKASFHLDATGHTVEGTVALRSGEIRFHTSTGAASGDVVVDLTRAATGSARRDKKMHEDVLETSRFPVAVFHAKRVTGTIAPSARSW